MRLDLSSAILYISKSSWEGIFSMHGTSLLAMFSKIIDSVAMYATIVFLNDIHQLHSMKASFVESICPCYVIRNRQNTEEIRL